VDSFRFFWEKQSKTTTSPKGRKRKTTLHKVGFGFAAQQVKNELNKKVIFDSFIVTHQQTQQKTKKKKQNI